MKEKARGEVKTPREIIEEAAKKSYTSSTNPREIFEDGFFAGALLGVRIVVEFAEKYQLGTPVKLPHPMVEIATLKKLMKEIGADGE